MLTPPDLSRPSQTPARRHSPCTLGDIQAMLDEDSELEERRRKSIGGAIRALCSTLGRPPTAVPASMFEIDALLKGIPASPGGRSKKTIDNARSLVKGAVFAILDTPALPHAVFLDT